MTTVTIIKKQKANDHYGESNWKTFYCMKDDKGNYKAYDNNKHATLANTKEATREGKEVTGGSNGIVYKKVTWDECKNNVTLGGLMPCDKISSGFDEQEMVDDGMSSKTMYNGKIQARVVIMVFSESVAGQIVGMSVP